MVDMIFVDVHAHLDFDALLDDIDRVIENAKKAGVKVVVTNGVGPKTNRIVLDLAERFDIVKPALGFYPLDALGPEEDGPLGADDVESELDFIRSHDPIAIGEVGLDLKHGKDIDLQIIVFKKMIDIAKEKDIPVIVHCRKAEQQALDVLEESGHKKVVLHCFDGKKNQVKRAAELGFSFSIPACIVKSEHFQNIVKEVHISQLLTETDSPFLTPFPGKMNEPAFVVEATRKIAEIKGMTLEDAANNIFMNYQKMFL